MSINTPRQRAECAEGGGNAEVRAGAQARHFAARASSRLLLARCCQCQWVSYPPRALCPACGSIALESVTAGGRGRVYATTVVRRRVEEGGDYNVCLIDLEDGVRVMSAVIDVAPQDVRVGMRVQAWFGAPDATGRDSMLWFRPTAEPAQELR